MIEKEAKVEYLKFFIRAAEVFFFALVVAPLAAFLLKREFPLWTVVAACLTGLAGTLTSLAMSYILYLRWKR